MTEQQYEDLHSALNSARMEGFNVTEQTEQDCIRLLNGEISIGELVAEILARHSSRKNDTENQNQNNKEETI